ncbi:DNA methyltransferase, partial [Escherichia coli]|uniref:DNA methyltransferase n=1 Tax=Escherichia coli TaxID=562 RepID=UPI003EE10719
SGNRHHPTEKPVTSLQPLIESFTHPNAIVLDPFAVKCTVIVSLTSSGNPSQRRCPVPLCSQSSCSI